MKSYHSLQHIYISYNVYISSRGNSMCEHQDNKFSKCTKLSSDIVLRRTQKLAVDGGLWRPNSFLKSHFKL